MNIDKKYHHRYGRREKLKANGHWMTHYRKRDEVLSELGYRSYQEYLDSDDWKVIKNRVLKDFPTCLACNKPSQVVHHVKYSASVLLGLEDIYLASLCHKCHELIEVDKSGIKRGLGKANNELMKLAAANNKHGWLGNLAQCSAETKKNRKRR
jgi:hypothetical protein